jgi:hypothetical protein
LHSHLTSVLLAIFVIVFTLIHSVFHINNQLRRGRGCLAIFSAFSVVLGVVAIFAGLVLPMFLKVPHQKGPADGRVPAFVQYALGSKYGTGQGITYTIESFTPDSPDSKSGTYRVHFKYGQHIGIILCHYDQPSQLFDSHVINESG